MNLILILFRTFDIQGREAEEKQQGRRGLGGVTYSVRSYSPGSDAFTWRDGSPLGYLNWDTDNPRGDTEDGAVRHCAQLSPRSGRWSDDECSAQYGYVCMKSKGKRLVCLYEE